MKQHFIEIYPAAFFWLI